MTSTTQTQNKQTPKDAPKDKKRDKKKRKRHQEATKLQARPMWFVRFLRFMLMFALALVAFFNIQPYIAIVGWFLETVQPSGLIAWVMNVPAIGIPVAGFLAAIWEGLQFSGGLILWAIFQALQLLPTVVAGTQETRLIVIRAAERAPQLKVRNKDRQFVKHLKNAYNNDPASNFRKLQYAMAAAYLIDFLLCSWFFGVIQNWGTFNQSFSVRGLVMTAITVAAFQIAFNIFVMLKNTSYLLKGGTANAE